MAVFQHGVIGGDSYVPCPNIRSPLKKIMVRPNGTKLTILQYWCTYSQQRDTRETNSHFKWLCSKKTKVFLNFKIICYIKQGNLNFCCTGPTVPNFWQIKIKIIILLISHINISFFVIDISPSMIFSF